MDVGQLESVTTFPLWPTFWRQANETSARHRNPSFSRETHISPCSIASDSRAVEMHSCRCIETWHVDTGRARADVGPTLQEGTACVVSNAKFEASVDPSPQTSGPEAVDAGQSSASKARYKGGGDGGRHWSLSRTSRSGTLHAWVPRACAGCGVRMRDVMRPTPRVQRAFVLRPLASIRGPPKWRLTLHIGARAGFSGNPQFHNTFLDEDWNDRVAKLAAGCHRITWEKRTILLLLLLVRFRTIAGTKTVTQRQ